MPTPVRRVRGEREQDRHVHAHPVGDVDRLVGVVDPHVDVQSEDDLLARDEPQRRDQLAVARARGHALVLPHRERMRPRRADQQPAPAGRLGDRGAQLPQLPPGRRGVRMRRGGDLEDRLEQLRLDAVVLAVLLEDSLDRVGERQRLGVEDHQLLLDPDREAGAGEVRLHGAAYSTRLRYRRTTP
jgi:hypothetical protein